MFTHARVSCLLVRNTCASPSPTQAHTHLSTQSRARLHCIWTLHLPLTIWSLVSCSLSYDSNEELVNWKNALEESITEGLAENAVMLEIYENHSNRFCADCGAPGQSADLGAIRLEPLTIACSRCPCTFWQVFFRHHERKPCSQVASSDFSSELQQIL